MTSNEGKNHTTERTPLLEQWSENTPAPNTSYATMSGNGAATSHTRTEEGTLSWAEMMYRFEYDQPVHSRAFQDENDPELGIMVEGEEEGGRGPGFWSSFARWLMVGLVVVVLFCWFLWKAVQMEREGHHHHHR